VTASIVDKGIVHITAAGNEGRNSYESEYKEVVNSTIKFKAHNFTSGKGVDTLQKISLPEGELFFLILQWDDPGLSSLGLGGATSDLDIFVTNESGTRILDFSSTDNLGRDPVEFLLFGNPEGSSESQFNILITHAAGTAPTRLKYIFVGKFGGAINEYDTQSSTIIGHANAPHSIVVGAVNFENTPSYGATQPLLRHFSSAGGTPLIYGVDSGRFVTPVTFNKPDVVAPDGVATTFFGVDESDDGAAVFNGTSAAAPHVAGVVALMLEAGDDLKPNDIKEILSQSAIDITQRDNDTIIKNSTGFDSDSGFGLVDARRAVELSLNYIPQPASPINFPDSESLSADNIVSVGLLSSKDALLLLLLLSIRRYLELSRLENSGVNP